MRGEHYADKKEPSFATICLIIIALFLLVFTALCLVIFVYIGQAPDTLIACVYSVCGAETIGLLVKSILKKKDTEESEDVEDGNNDDYR